jgi:hypothetical protein
MAVRSDLRAGRPLPPHSWYSFLLEANSPSTIKFHENSFSGSRVPSLQTDGMNKRSEVLAAKSYKHLAGVRKPVEIPVRYDRQTMQKYQLLAPILNSCHARRLRTLVWYIACRRHSLPSK